MCGEKRQKFQMATHSPSMTLPFNIFKTEINGCRTAGESCSPNVQLTT